MHAWTKSACVLLAWSVLSIILMTAGMKESVHPAQANTRTKRSTEIILTSTSTLSVAAAPMTATSSPASYVVQPGDSLAAIAARFAVPGGWPALYGANQRRIGPDPDAIRPGTVVVLPGVRTPIRYTVAAGDTLAGLAAGLAVRGGWPALYKANSRAIGPDPDAIRTRSGSAPCWRSRSGRHHHRPGRPRPPGSTRPRRRRRQLAAGTVPGRPERQRPPRACRRG
jgi:LysM repeat protein